MEDDEECFPRGPITKRLSYERKRKFYEKPERLFKEVNVKHQTPYFCELLRWPSDNILQHFDCFEALRAFFHKLSQSDWQAGNKKKEDEKWKLKHDLEQPDWHVALGDQREDLVPKSYIDFLSFQKLTEGMSLLGCVTDITAHELVIRLPNYLPGFVKVNCISSLYSTALMEELNSGGVDPEKIAPMLQDLFQINQLVVCCIESLHPLTRRIELTLDPQVVNSNLRVSKLKPGMLISGCVKSLEDHGYSIDIGKTGVNAFIPIAHSDSTVTLKSCQVIRCAVVATKCRGMVLTLSNENQTLTKPLGKFTYDTSTDMLFPGTMVKFFCTEELPEGKFGKVFTSINACVPMVNLVAPERRRKNKNEGDDVSEEQPKRKKKRGNLEKDNEAESTPVKKTSKPEDGSVIACILYVTVTKMVVLAINPKVWQVEERQSHKDMLLKEYPLGHKFKADILRKIMRVGIVCRLDKTGTLGMIHLRNISDTAVQPDFSDFPDVKNMQVRVTGNVSLDGVVELSSKTSVLNVAYLRLQDVKCGEVVEAKILGRIGGSFKVLIGSYHEKQFIPCKDIFGIIPLVHMSDVVLKKPGKRFKEGDILTCRVLSTEVRYVLLTHKPSLVNSDDPIVTSFHQLEPGQIITGTIFAIQSFGILIKMFNNVKALVPRQEFGQMSVVDLEKEYHLGQVKRCRVVRCFSDEQKATLSFKLSSPDFPYDSESKTNENTALPERSRLVDVKVSDKMANCSLEVIIEDPSISLHHNVTSVVVANHLSDFPTLAKAKFAHLDVGSLLKAVVLQWRPLKITMKESFVEYMESQEKDLSLTNLEKNALFPGFITTVNPNGALVRIPGGLVGLCPRRFMSDRFSSDHFFTINQSVVAVIQEIDSNEKSFCVKLNPTSIPSSVPERIVKYHEYSSSFGEAVLKENSLDVGEVVQVTAAHPGGKGFTRFAIEGIDEDSVTGIFPNSDEAADGPAVVIYVDLANRKVILCNHESVLSFADSGLKQKKISTNSSLLCRLLFTNSDVTIGFIVSEDDHLGQLMHLSTLQHWNESPNSSFLFTVGCDIDVLVLKQFSDGLLLGKVSDVPAVTESPMVGRQISDQLHVERKVDVKVHEVKPTIPLVDVYEQTHRNGQTIRGRINASEIKDEHDSKPTEKTTPEEGKVDLSTLEKGAGVDFTMGDVKRAPLRKKKVKDKQIPSNNPSEQDKQATKIHQTHSYDLHIGDQVDVKVHEVKPTFLIVDVSGHTHPNGQTIRGRIHASEIKEEHEHHSNPTESFKVGQTLSCHVLGYRDETTMKFVELAFAVKPSLELLDLSLRRSTPDQSDESGLSHEKYSVGKEITAFVAFVGISQTSVKLHVAAGLKPVYMKQFALADDELDLITSEKLLGKSLRLAVLSNVNGNLKLAAKGAAIDGKTGEDLTSWKRGCILNGEIAKIGNDFVDVLTVLGSGTVHITDLFDIFFDRPLENFKVGQLVKCRVLNCKDKTRVALSLKESLMRVGAKMPRDKITVKSLKERQLVDGYVKSIESNGFLVTLSRNCIGQLAFNHVTDECSRKELCKILYPGKAVACCVLTTSPKEKVVDDYPETSPKNRVELSVLEKDVGVDFATVARKRTVEDVKSAPQPKKKLQDKQIPSNNPSEQVKQAAKIHQKHANDLHMGDQVDVKVHEVKPTFLIVDISGYTHPNGQTIRGRIHASEIKEEHEHHSNPTESFKVGQTLSCHVLGYRDETTMKFVELAFAVKPSLVLVDLSLRRSTPDQSDESGLSHEKYSVGKEITAFVAFVDNSHMSVKLHVAAGLKPVYMKQFALADDELDLITAEKLLGKSLRLTVLSNVNGNLKLAAKGAAIDGKTGENLTSWKRGCILNGEIAKIGNDFLDVLTVLGSGRVHITDLFDTFFDRAVTNFKVGQLVKCRVLDCEDETRVALALKESLVRVGAGMPRDDVTAKSLKQRQLVKGYVTAISKNFIGISLSRNQSGTLTFDHVSARSLPLANLKRVFFPGKALTCCVLKTDPEEGQVDLSVLEKDVGFHYNAVTSKRPMDSEGYSRLPGKKTKLQKSSKTHIEMLINEANTQEDVVKVDETIVHDNVTQVCDGDAIEEPGFVWDDNDDVKARDDVSDEDSGIENNQTKPKLTKKEKAALIEQQEEKLRKREFDLMDETRNPENADDWERLLTSNPDNSMYWVRYMAFHIHATEIEKARAVAEKALKTINFREESEKLNVWAALLNLENLYGSDVTMDETIARALEQNDQLKVLNHLVNIYTQAGKTYKAEEVHKRLVKRFRGNKEVWLAYMRFLLVEKRPQDAQSLMKRAVESLHAKQHLEIVSKFAKMEFELGDEERGRTMFENAVSSYPKRTDIWSMYIDTTSKAGRIDLTREIFNRVTSIAISSKKMKSFIKRFVEFESKYGNDVTVNKAKQKATEYVELVTKRATED